MKTLTLIQLLLDGMAAICALFAIILNEPIEPWAVLCWIFVAFMAHIKEYKEIKK